ncbi:hypothetical protein ARMSODRAFT_1023511 [Armillaria solidipes]|uniref:Uncharacterized protein n=1 Tax=Armillaria solidipes TaxID=1076256 RepID=A0A2H3BLC3_9AGAR|nr:hypothetical protein ARMSODRAFT_1023511 [Armillaria solidipes]
MALNVGLGAIPARLRLMFLIFPDSLRILLRGDIPAADNILTKIEADAMASDEDEPACAYGLRV